MPAAPSITLCAEARTKVPRQWATGKLCSNKWSTGTAISPTVPRSPIGFHWRRICRRNSSRSRKSKDTAPARSAPRAWARAACSQLQARSPMRSRTPSACASRRFPLRRKRFCAHLRRRSRQIVRSAAEKRLLYFRVCEQLCARSRKRNAAECENIAAVGDFKGFLGILLDQQNGDVAAPDPFDLAVNLFYHQRRKTKRRFVQHEQARAQHQTAADRQHLPLTA